MMKTAPDAQHDILIVDDEPDVRTVLVRTLVRAGHPRPRLHEAGSVEEAMQKCFLQPFACVVSDYMLGGRNGAELLSWLHDNHPLTARALMTGYQEHHIAIDAINHGHAEAYIQKPWEDEDVVRTVQGLLRAHRKRVHVEQALHQALLLAAKTAKRMPPR